MGFWEESVAFLGVEVWSSAERCVCSAVGFVDALGCRHSSWLVASDAQETKTSGCGGPAVLLSINCCCCCSTAKLCLTLSNPMDCSTPGSSVLHYLLEFPQAPVYWVGDAIPPISSSVVPFSSYSQSLVASGSFPTSWFFTSGGQSIGAQRCLKIISWIQANWQPGPIQSVPSVGQLGGQHFICTGAGHKDR